MTSLRKPECKQLAEEMSAVKFEKGAAREQEIAYSQVIAFIRAANGMGQKGMIPAERALYMSIAVAAQFELMLRQADIIGQWAPLNPAPRLPKGASTLIEGSKIWSAFFTWELVPGWRWRMKTSKSKCRAGQEFMLRNYELLFPLLEAVPHARAARRNRQGRAWFAGASEQLRQVVPADRACRRHPRRCLEHGCTRRRRDGS
jgi:hypothetical protein